MRRRDFLAGTGAAAAWPLAAVAQEAVRIYRVGYLSNSARSASYNVVFSGDLGRLGFIEGQNLIFEFREFGQRIELLPKFAKELVEAQVEVIVAGGDLAFAPHRMRRRRSRSSD